MSIRPKHEPWPNCLIHHRLAPHLEGKDLDGYTPALQPHERGPPLSKRETDWLRDTLIHYYASSIV